MKKYFMKGADEELKFGDFIELDLTKDMEDGSTKHHHLECKFVPELVDMLLESDVIEYEDDEEDDVECPLDDVYESIDGLIDRVETLEKKVASMQKTIASMIAKSVDNVKGKKTK